MKLKPQEKLGLLNGYVLGLFTGAISFLRQSRIFHPRGVTYRAHASEVSPEVILPPHVLLRFSSAWWKNREWTDVLGIAVRFSHSPEFTEVARSGDQDLLFATIRHPWTMPFAPFTTVVNDFLKNKYYAVSPFIVPGRPSNHHVEFRLVPQNDSPAGKNRKEKLEAAVQLKAAGLTLEYRTLKPKLGTWLKVARIDLSEQIHLDQEALQFSAFRTGAGIHPRGFVHYLRVGAYRFSRALRPKHASTPGKSN